MELSSKKRFAGCLELVGEVGKGGMGSVLLARGENDKPIAIKLLSNTDLKKEDYIIERFKSEFSILKELSHPGINHVYDFGLDEETDQYYFTSEFIEGKHFLDATKGMGVEGIEELFVQMLRALQYLHSHGIMHGDIKSGNVLVETLDEGGHRAKVIDFGIAVLGSPDRVMGTPSYMAPEVIQKRHPDGRADLYSLGVLIYAALTRFNPFLDNRMERMFQKQLDVIPEAPSKRNGNVPDYFDSIVLKLLEKEPEKRFQSAAEVIRTINFKGRKKYPVETVETFLGYIPVEGNLVGRKDEIERIKTQAMNMKEGISDTASLLFIVGDVGTGRGRLLSELKYFAQLNEMDVVELGSADRRSIDSFNEGIEYLIKGDSKSSVVICRALAPLALRGAAGRTFDLLGRLIRRIKMENAIRHAGSDKQTMIAISAHPDEIPFLEHMLGLEGEISIEGVVNLVKLDNFDKSQTKEYLCTLMGIENIPDAIVMELYKRTMGNPLFITEMIKELIGEGVLFDEFGRWNKESIDDIGIHFETVKVPTSLEGILRRKYHACSEDEIAVLEGLAAWHRSASQSEIEGVVTAIDVRRTLHELIRSDIIAYDAISSNYGFINDLMREVVYDGMTEEVKYSVHEKIVSHLKREKPKTFYEMRWHESRCGDLEQAINSSIELGMRYLKEGSALEAMQSLEDAQTRLQDGGYRKDDIMLHLGESNVVARRYDEAIAIYEGLLEDGRDGGDVDKITLIQKLGIAHLRKGDISEGRAYLEMARSMLEGMDGEEIIKLKNINFLGRAAFLEGKLEESKKLYENSKERWLKLSGDMRCEVLNNDLAHIYFKMGMLDLAESVFDEDIDFYSEVGADAELERSYYASAELFREKGDVDRAADYFEMAISIAKRISDSEMLLYTYNGLGNLFSTEGEHEKGLYWYGRGLDLAMRLGDESVAAAILLNIGLIYSEENKLDEAMESLNSCVSLLERSKLKGHLDQSNLHRAHHELAKVHKLKKGPIEASQYAAKSRELAKSLHELESEASSMEGPRADEVSGTKLEKLSILDIHEIDSLAGGDDMELKHYRYILEINKYLSGETNLDFVLKTILKYALELSGAMAGFVLLTKDDGAFSIEASYNIEVDENVSEIGATIAREAIEKDEIISTQNATADERFKSSESIILLDLHSVMCVPIHSGKRAIGVIYLENRTQEGAFDDVDRDLVSAYADQAGIAIENARLMDGYRTARRRLEEELDESHIELEKLHSRVKSQTSELRKTYRFDKLESTSPKMKSIFEILERISGSELSVCVVGESGTGKELIAKAIHYNSTRSDGSFVAINCGAIPATLVESELFGYKAGAFTGANKDKVGLFEAASGGTIFLDEIAELELPLQAKLLRVIQEREVMRVGDTKPMRCDVRVICATNRKLEELVEGEGFRQDLYYRIAEIKVELPSLKERREDIPFLIGTFVREYCEQHGLKEVPKVDSSFVRACMSYDWPGNIRELENAVRVASALVSDERISVKSLPENHAVRCLAGRSVSSSISIESDGIDKLYNPKKGWRDYEAEMIAAVYRLCEYNAKVAAGKLKISVATMYKRICELKLKNKDNPLFRSSHLYKPEESLNDLLILIFRAAWEYSGKKPYKAAKLLGISHGYFYKVMKRF